MCLVGKEFQSPYFAGDLAHEYLVRDWQFLPQQPCTHHCPCRYQTWQIRRKQCVRTSIPPPQVIETTSGRRRAATSLELATGKISGSGSISQKSRTNLAPRFRRPRCHPRQNTSLMAPIIGEMTEAGTNDK